MVKAALQRLEPNERKRSCSVLRGVRNSNVSRLLDYCSCERLFQPKLEGRPVVTLSNNDGCVRLVTRELNKRVLLDDS